MNDFKINTSFAQRFEHNKKREEIQQLQEKYGNDSNLDSEEDSEEEQVEDEIGELDYHRKALLNENEKDVPTVKSFVEEQTDIKQSFLNALKDDIQDESELFSIRREEETLDSKSLIESSHADIDVLEKKAYSNFLLSQLDGLEKKKWTNANKKNQSTEKNDDTFLMQFVLNRGWVDPEKDKIPTYQEITMHDNTDDEDEERMDDFEAKYNFRFEEKRKDNTRTLKRQSEKEKKEAQKLKKQQELMRLKNLKKEELSLKLKKIQEMAGGSLIGLDNLDFEKEFDPNDYDQQMTKETKGSGKPKKPTWDEDIDISDIVPNTNLESVSKKLELKSGEHIYENNFEDQHQIDASRSKTELQTDLDKYLEEYYQLDYEDLIGDIPVRFKYRNVDPESYSLKTEEILLADDTDLNNVVSLKKLAPFRSQQMKEKDSHKWKITKKKRLWEFRSKLKGKTIAKQLEVDHNKSHNKRLQKDAKIDQSRLESYGLSSGKKSKSRQ
ncbi:hypothetical protein HDU91_002536 [Kappamyces sp. JEL0680]|nr:hypothetical protein HDU91_002536 [Kappamyces sp. JEL0680]